VRAMATSRVSERTSLTFEATGGLFGPATQGIDWDVFLGIGSLDGPLRAPFSIGGPVTTWLPFVGDVEVLRAGLSGEFSTRIGLEASLDISPGETRARMPYDVGFSFPDTQTLSANPFFRLEGDGVYTDDTEAGFETDWPYLAFSLNAIFEMAMLAELEMGVLGNNTTRKLMDFDIASAFPLIDIDTRDRTEKANRTETLFGLDLGEIAELNGTFTPDPDEEEEEEGPLLDLNLGDRYSFTFDLDGVDFFKSAEKDSEREKSKEKTEDDAKDDTDPDAEKKPKEEKQKKSILDQFDNGNLAQLDLQLPRIELDGKGTDRDLSTLEKVKYSARTLTAAEAAALEVQRDRDGNMPEGVQDPRDNELARLNLDVDNILVEIVKGTLAGPALQKVPGFEGRIDLPFSIAGFGAGAYFDYNLFDADLNFILPIRQEVSVETQPLQTRLSFSRADAAGTVIEDEGAQEAFFINARAPRYSVYFNEGASFYDEAVAALLRSASQQSARAAEDVALFTDLAGRRIPGAFTGQTGGVAGTFASSTDGGTTWLELTTFPEETEWLARSRPVIGREQRLEDLRPRDDALFRYVVTDDDTQRTAVDIGGGILRNRINLGSAVGSVPVDFEDLVGAGGVFDLRIDAVTAPISTTGFIEGVPSLDLVFPGITGESVWVEVEHMARAVVDNRTTLDFDMNIALSALEFAFGAYVQAFGGRFGLDFEFGPLWEKIYPIFSTTLAALYDDSFEIGSNDFIAAPVGEADFTAETPATQDRWGFAIGASGEADPLVLAGTPADDALDAAAIMGRQPGGTPVVDATVDGRSGNDTLDFLRLAETRTVYADLARGAAFLGWTTPDFDGFVEGLQSSNRIQLTGGGLRLAGAAMTNPAVATEGLSFSTSFDFSRDIYSEEIVTTLPIGGFIDNPTGRGLAFVISADGTAPATASFGLPSSDTPSVAVVYSETNGGLQIIRNADTANPLVIVPLEPTFGPTTDPQRRLFIDYADGLLEVRVAPSPPSTSLERGEQPWISLPIDLAAVVGPQAHLGVAASNGGNPTQRSNFVDDWALSVADGTDLRPPLQTAFDDFTLSGDAVLDNFTSSLVQDRGRLFVDNVENIIGGRLADLLRGDGNDNRLEGGEGDDRLEGRDGFDTLIGGPGSDVLDLGGPGDGEGREEAFGGDGNDRIIAGAAPGRYDGGSGAPVGADALIPVDLDVIDYRHAPAGLLIDLDTGETAGPWIGGHEIANFEGIAGSDFGDTLRGDTGRSYIEGGGGGDLIVGSPLGEGLSRTDRLTLPGGPDRLYGFEGDDTLIGGPGADMLDGGPGRDLVDYSADPVSVFVDMADGIQVDAERFAPLLIPAGTDPTDYARIDGRGWRGWAQGDKLRDVEDLQGTAFDDILFGDAGANRIRGGAGDDRIAGRFGNDTLEGEDGDDILWSRSGDTLRLTGSFTPQEREGQGPQSGTTDAPLTLGAPLTTLDIDSLDGGDGRDIGIIQWTPGVEIVQPNILVSGDPNSIFIPVGSDIVRQERYDYELRYVLPGASQRLVASLEDGAAWTELLPTTEPLPLEVTGARLAGRTSWNVPGFTEPRSFFGALFGGDGPLETASNFGDYFLDAPSLGVVPALLRSDIATLTGLDGLITRDTPDFLIGTEADEALYSGAGADLIAAQGGDDVLSFGPGQPPEQIFSFPGRGYAGLADLEARLGDSFAESRSAVDPAATDQRIGNTSSKVYTVGTTTRVPDYVGTTTTTKSGDRDFAFDLSSWGGSTTTSTVSGSSAFDPVARLTLGTPPAAPAAQAAIDALLGTYLASARNGAALDTLAAGLAAADDRLAGYAILDGGSGRNSLDMRHDRGIDFLNRGGDFAVMVDLQAEATRFQVQPGLALPRERSDTPDPSARAWTALPAFTTTGGVGEARFVQPSLAETTNAAISASAAGATAPPLPETVRPALVMGIADMIGTDFNDWLFGDDGPNIIEGGGGTLIARLAPRQGGESAVVAFFSDWLDGRGGHDVLSYAHAVGGVTLVLGQDADGLIGLQESAGDALGDLFTGFEEIRGSEVRDRLGFVSGGTVNPLNADYTANAIAVIDAGGGNDLILAQRAGVTFLGGDGADVIEINFGEDPAQRGLVIQSGAFVGLAGLDYPAGGPARMAVDGGAGTDIARVSGVLLDGLTLDGDTLLVTERLDPDLLQFVGGDPAEALLVTSIDGVEYVEIGAGAVPETLALVNTSPVVEAAKTLTFGEDPWSVRRVFAESGPGSPPADRVATVERLSAAGTFALEAEDGTQTPLTLGQALDAEALARVVFIPNQQFAIPRSIAADGTPLRAGAELGLSFRDDDGPAQPRTIRVEPGDMDGAALGIATPSDVDHPATTAAPATNTRRDTTGRPIGDTVRLFRPDDLLAEREALLTRIEAEEAREDQLVDLVASRQATLNSRIATRNARQAELNDLIKRDNQWWTTIFVSQADINSKRAQRDAAQNSVNSASAALNDARRELNAQRAEIAELEADLAILDGEIRTGGAGDLLRADAYTLTALTEGGALWRSPNPEAETPALGSRVEIGTVLARAEMGSLVFVKESGSIEDSDAVSLTPLETLTAVVTQVPESGFVFNPIIAMDLDPAVLAGFAEAGSAELLAAPADGTLFYRAADGSRVPVAAGDTLTPEQLAGLFFEAGIARQATESDPVALLAAIEALNLPTLDLNPDPEEPPRADGSGAAPIPLDATALALQLDLAGPAAAPVDGLVVDMDAAGLTALRADPRLIDFRGQPLDWRQWRVEDGGNGHFYAVGSQGQTSSSQSSYFANISDFGTPPYTLASIGSAAENDFVFDLFADDPTMLNRQSATVALGPIIGGAYFEIDPSLPNDTSPRQWGWYDGTPWEFSAWREGEPNNAGGREWYLHYAVTIVDEDERLFLPTWNDTTSSYGSPGWVLETAGLATARNDVIDGSTAADSIQAGHGHDLVRGGEGADTIDGGAGNDTLDGGPGDDSLIGGSGNDIFVMTPDGGTDRIEDFALPDGAQIRDRIDVSALGLRALGELRITQPSAFEIAVHAGGQTLIFEDMGEVDPAIFTSPLLYIGAPRHIAAVMPEAESLSLAIGDTLDPDALTALRYRAAQDFTGDAGRFAYEVRDPWALPDGIAGLDDPRPDDADGISDGSVAIALDALNDAPRASDRSHHFTEGRPLDGRVPELRLTATDPEGDPVRFALVDGPAHGTLALDSDGGWFYQPDAAAGDDFDGLDSFRYTVADDTATSDVYTVQLQMVQAENAAARQSEPVEGRFRIGGRSADDLLRGLDDEDNEIDAGPGNDTVEGGGGDNLIDLGSGHDILIAGSGPERVTLGLGADTIDGDIASLDATEIGDFTGEDTIRLRGASLSQTRLEQAADDETRYTLEAVGSRAALRFDNLVVPEGASAANASTPLVRLDPGPDGTTLLRMADAPFEGTALTGGADRAIVGDSARAVDGGAASDVIVDGGSSGGLSLFGGDSDDLLIGGDGPDVLVGGPGSDILRGGGGADRFAFAPGSPGDLDIVADFEAGLDHVALSGFGLTTADLTDPGFIAARFLTAADSTILTLPDGARILFRGITDAADILAALDVTEIARVSGAGPDEASVDLGNGGSRFQTRTAAPLALNGGAGDDALLGGPGPDTLRGGGGNDTLSGGGGDDLLEPGTGFSTVFGGAGADVFVYRPAPATQPTGSLIEDFERGADRIDLRAFADIESTADLSYGSQLGALSLVLPDDLRLVVRNLPDTVRLAEEDFLFA
jgi:Ca2+-binding RTX toxin-like protein